MTNLKKQWFDVPDSLMRKPSGNGFVHNIEARFSDHPAINVEKSKVARRAVYEWTIVLHTRVKYGPYGKAVDNTSSHVMRFDKGAAMGEMDFNKAKAAIMRCWDAWQHYQTWREAPVTVAEQMALEQIEQAPLSSIGTVKVSVGDKLVDARLSGDDGEAEDSDDDDLMPANAVVRKPVARPVARKGKRVA